MAAPRLVPLVEPGQFDAQHGSLELVEAPVQTKSVVMVAHGRSMIAQAAHAPRQLRVIRHHAPCFTIGAQVLGTVKAETAHIAECARGPAVAACPMCLAGILDDA